MTLAAWGKHQAGTFLTKVRAEIHLGIFSSKFSPLSVYRSSSLKPPLSAGVYHAQSTEMPYYENERGEGRVQEGAERLGY